jgi:muramoyltetrapeptide carboxypeptidase LdcA involved in peptidoglycan recycling
MIDPLYPTKPRPGDRVAVLSPSSGLPGLFPLPYELGLRRLLENFGLEAVEYPTTRKMGATPEERAADIHAAFADPDIKAVIASIGGDDQITVLPHLDHGLLRANPKPFFGYSDNTNLLLFLRNLGIVSYHGGSVMVQFGRPSAMHPMTEDSLRSALFTSDKYELTSSNMYGDVSRPWEDPHTFESEPEMEPADGWSWHNGDRVVEGITWGGNLEIISWLLMQQVPALLMGRARSWSFEKPLSAQEKADFRQQQREAVLRALQQYAPDTMAVFDVDLGHTDPQLVVPVGGRIRVDGPARRIIVTY